MKSLEKYILENHIDQIFDSYEEIKPYFSLKRFKAGTIMQIDRKVGELYFFIEGVVNVRSDIGDGKNMILSLGESMELLGELEFLSPPNLTDKVFIEVKKPSLAVVLKTQSIRDQLMNDNGFLRYALYNLADKCIAFQSRQLINYSSNSRERVADLLLSRASNGVFKENHRVMAELVGMSYRHFHRVLHSFTEEGLIEKIDGGYKINKKLLQAELKE